MLEMAVEQHHTTDMSGSRKISTKAGLFAIRKQPSVYLDEHLRHIRGVILAQQKHGGRDKPQLGITYGAMPPVKLNSFRVRS